MGNVGVVDAELGESSVRDDVGGRIRLGRGESRLDVSDRGVTGCDVSRFTLLNQPGLAEKSLESW